MHWIPPSYFLIKTRSLPALARCYPRSFYVDHSHCLVLAPATLAALPSIRAMPNRDVFYVAHPIRSIQRFTRRWPDTCAGYSRSLPDHGLGRGCGVGRGLGNAVDLGVAVGVAVIVGVGLAVTVAVGVGVTVAVGLGVGVGVRVGVRVGVALA